MYDNLFPVIVQAVAGDNYTVFAYMLDGTVRRVPVLPLIEQGGIFERLRDPAFFRDALTVLNDTVAWDLSGELDPANCIDLDPFMIADCESIADPLLAA